MVPWFMPFFEHSNHRSLDASMTFIHMKWACHFIEQLLVRDTRL